MKPSCRPRRSPRTSSAAPARASRYTLAQLDALYGFQNLTDAQNGVVTASGGRDKHLVEVTEPISIDSKLKVRGFELTWQQPLDMLPIKGFGFCQLHQDQADRRAPQLAAGGWRAAFDDQPHRVLQAWWLELPRGPSVPGHHGHQHGHGVSMCRAPTST